MQIDASTILLFGLFIKGLLCALFLVFWLYERTATWFAWWSATFALGSVAGFVFLLKGFAGDMFSIGAGVAALIAAFGCVWHGARAFERRRPVWFALLLVPAAWIAVCLLPGFLLDLHARVVVSSLLIAPLLVMASIELWRGRSERLSSRWPIIVLFGTMSLVFVSRIVCVDLLPFPFGALPEQPSSVAVFNLMLFLHTLILTVLMVAISKERQELEQRTKAQTDPLTGALNRRAFMIRGGRLILRHQVEGAPLCLLFLDLDHFKSLNDRLGHFAGDDVLMKFVAVVHEHIRPTDFLFRLGGEEFCCLLPQTTTMQAHRVAERIRHRFEMASVEVTGRPVRSTVSVGIASSEIFGYDVDTLLRRADGAVYAAKRQGRNCVVVATKDDAVPAAANFAVAEPGISAAI